jgi:hypothetical protein
MVQRSPAYPLTKSVPRDPLLLLPVAGSKTPSASGNRLIAEERLGIFPAIVKTVASRMTIFCMFLVYRVAQLGDKKQQFR